MRPFDNQKPERFAGHEHSCTEFVHSHILTAPPNPGIERIEARFNGRFFEPHRHDTYAIGVTLKGVQTFGYRGARQYSTPGRIIVLHPDEVHDGAAATEEGLRYRMLYLSPALLRKVLGRDQAPLPFVGSPVIDDPQMRAALLQILGDLDKDLPDLLIDDLLGTIAEGLSRHSDRPAPGSHRISFRAAEAARACLHENPCRAVTSGDLEQVTGLDRFALARHFRAAFGTSPHRYLTLRRLDLSRRMMADGHSLAETASAAGFADQSHLTRHFKKCYGITPGRWMRMTAASAKPPRSERCGATVAKPAAGSNRR